VVSDQPLAGLYCPAAANIYTAAFVLAVASFLIGILVFPIVSCHRPACCIRAAAAVSSASTLLQTHYQSLETRDILMRDLAPPSRQPLPMPQSLPLSLAPPPPQPSHPLKGSGWWSSFLNHLYVAPPLLITVEAASWVIVFSVCGVICTCISMWLNANYNYNTPAAIACTTQMGSAGAALVTALSAFIAAVFKVLSAGVIGTRIIAVPSTTPNSGLTTHTAVAVPSGNDGVGKSQ